MKYGMNIREYLINKLIEEKRFWSYNQKSINEHITDDQLIEATLIWLDLDEIDLLFDIFPMQKIKAVWRRTMVRQGDYFYSLNRFFAWYYFGIKRPDRYLKTMTTRYLSSLQS